MCGLFWVEYNTTVHIQITDVTFVLTWCTFGWSQYDQYQSMHMNNGYHRLMCFFFFLNFCVCYYSSNLLMDFAHLFQLIKLGYFVSINVGEYRRGNQKRKIQSNWQQRSKTKKNTTLYVLDTTMRKQTQIT